MEEKAISWSHTRSFPLVQVRTRQQLAPAAVLLIVHFIICPVSQRCLRGEKTFRLVYTRKIQYAGVEAAVRGRAGWKCSWCAWREVLQGWEVCRSAHPSACKCSWVSPRLRLCRWPGMYLTKTDSVYLLLKCNALCFLMASLRNTKIRLQKSIKSSPPT